MFAVATMILNALLTGKDMLRGSLLTTLTNVRWKSLPVAIYILISIQLLLLSESGYVLTMITLKLSLGVFFFRIMILRWQRIAVYIILILSTVVGFAYFLFAISWCGFPVSAKVYWSRLLSDQCIGPKPLLGMSYTHAVISAGTDLSLAALPIPMLIKSRIRRDEKWVVVGIFVVATA
jgi:hypothetical protein